MILAMIVSIALGQTGEITLPYEPGEMIQDTVTIVGTFAGYSLGDYYHAVFLLEDGTLETAWAPSPGLKPGLDVFMFLHRWELMEVTVANVEQELPEAGLQILPIVVDACAGGECYSEWLTGISQELGVESAADIHSHFGDPTETQELFDELEYVNGPAD